MEIVRKYQFNGRDAFKLKLTVNFRHGNIVTSTLPHEILRRQFFHDIHNAKYAYIPCQEYGDKLLDSLASKVLREAKMHRYFYPGYLLMNGIISDNVSDRIMNKMEIITCIPGSCYSQNCDPITFFVLQGQYLQDRGSILANAAIVGKTFFWTHCATQEMKIEYLRNRDVAQTAILIEPDSGPTMMLLIGKSKELLMAIFI